MRRAIIIGPLLALTACVKEELPVPVASRGAAIDHRVCMGTGYSQQIWFDVGTNAVVAENERGVWDLAFESAPDGWHVMLNGSRLMTAWDVSATDITAPHDTLGMHAGRRIDMPSGNPDSTAIGDWRNTGEVTVLDLGYSAAGDHLGLRKVRFDGMDATSFSFASAALDGSDVRSHVVTKDPTRTYSYFSFATG
ncbi:MAG TPA: hypothetical protein PK760_10845, partial [Flavobacteriales bacterium]|nr:hypothetical protein [Flavobacteriales bacterium]